MSVEQMRQYLLRYSSKDSTWYNRVKKMPDKQIIAIYYSMKARES